MAKQGTSLERHTAAKHICISVAGMMLTHVASNKSAPIITIALGRSTKLLCQARPHQHDSLLAIERKSLCFHTDRY